ncbi:isocitrate lyase/PEP mutase family protein [Bordetella genomosp. 4]|uniref:isocitrate lyase/PEP mutase family protein n=1 Tax=Bordetella genomosp. 4 TaxID=463044 RepID=UPI000B9DE432|nr:oxaloacetate decarboxylase [Bordetella genomosp. 4]OZI49594.1 carboxyvinyl-carboxyphosphonate phosphorylmutase [Bordetella genomosp. 4]
MVSDAIPTAGQGGRSRPSVRRMLAPGRTLVAPGASSPMVAKLVEKTGFQAVYMPGGGVALERHGVADLGLITMSEMVEVAASIVQAVNIPVIADADTGFGNALNVQRTVREYEHAGVAAIHLEDQVFPKRCGHLAGKELIPLEIAAEKIRAAVEARRDPNFMIIARCDALSVTGLDDVLRRCEAYLDAGADMLFVESLSSHDHIARIPQLLPARHLFNMTSSGKTPPLHADEVGRLGYQLMILPNFATLAAIKSVETVLVEIKNSGSVAHILDRCASFTEFTELGGLRQFQRIEQRFAPSMSTPGRE